MNDPEQAMLVPVEDLNKVPQPVPTQVFQVQKSPRERVEEATEIAKTLAPIIKSQKLYTVIQRKEHVQVEGWTALASLCGLFPREAWSKKREDGSWETYVELLDKQGMVTGGASAICGDPKDTAWKSRSDTVKKSMSITRATGKACRIRLSWIMVLAGYNPTPAEEMDREQGQTPATPPPEPARPEEPASQLQSQNLTMPQRKKLFAMAKDKKIPEELLKSHIKAVYGHDSTGDLSKQQASEMIDVLNDPYTSNQMDEIAVIIETLEKLNDADLGEEKAKSADETLQAVKAHAGTLLSKAAAQDLIRWAWSKVNEIRMIPKDDEELPF